MTIPFSENLARLKHAVISGAAPHEITALARKLHLPPNVSGADLADLYATVPGLLDANIGFAKAILLDKIEGSLYRGRKREIRFPWTAGEAESHLVPFFEYLDQHYATDSDSIYPIHTEWKVFLDGYPAAREVLKAYLQRMEARRNRPSGYVQSLEKALELRLRFKRILNVDFDAIDGWRECLSLLDGQCTLARSWAAKNLGALYRVDAGIVAESLPSFAELLQMMGGKEKGRAGVLGPFVDGYDDSAMGLASLHHNEELKNGNLDVREFVLDVLTQSPVESYCPDVQSLEFYAHEYFDCDADALLRLLRAGKNGIVEQALSHEYAFDGKEEVLARLASSFTSRS